MKHKNLMTIGIVMMLLVAFVGTAAAQTVEPPTATPEPTAVPVQPDSKFLNHPVVQILSAYFARAKQIPAAEPTITPTLDPNAPVVTPTPTEVPVDPQEQLAQEIAAYHEQGMGFGVLVKLYAMAEASQEACPPSTDPAVPATCTVVTVDELVNSFNSGTGMGVLFKQYGKPALLGVGHVRKMLNAQPASTVVPPTTEQLEKGNKPDKGPKNKGPKK